MEAEAIGRPPREVDEEGLLAALVLAPGTYARNRFFSLFREPRYRRVRRKAAQLRGLLRHLAGKGAGVVDARERAPDGGETIRYHVVRLSLTASVRLEPFEVALVDVALAIARKEEPPPEAAGIVNAAVMRLGPEGVTEGRDNS